METYSSILAWRIPRTEDSGGLQSVGLQESDTTEGLTLSLSYIYTCVCMCIYVYIHTHLKFIHMKNAHILVLIHA